MTLRHGQIDSALPARAHSRKDCPCRSMPVRSVYFPVWDDRKPNSPHTLRPGKKIWNRCRARVPRTCTHRCTHPYMEGGHPCRSVINLHTRKSQSTHARVNALLCADFENDDRGAVSEAQRSGSGNAPPMSTFIPTLNRHPSTLITKCHTAGAHIISR